MPLRVAKRVVLLDRISLDMGHLAMAIHGAAIGDPNFVQRSADIISISLGGTPSRAVMEALRVAAERGTIVVAAAGNYVGPVVFPAGYSEAIAVAASNIQSRAWRNTSGGTSVEIAAPGETVWVATQKRYGDDVYTCVQTASGTSYAAAAVAGVAALWLSYHDDKMSQITDRAGVFRKLIGETARRPAGWNSRLHGPGIIDATAILERPPLDVAPERQEGAVCDDFAALSDLMGTQRPLAPVELLFGSGVPAPEACRTVGHLADEVAFLSVTDGQISGSMARFRSRPEEKHAIRALRQTVLARPLSPTLRKQLMSLQPQDDDSSSHIRIHGSVDEGTGARRRSGAR